MQLRTHAITLRDKGIVLRPMTEDDWPILLKWNSDPEVLYFSEGDDVSSRTLEEIQMIYRSVSQTGFYFIAEMDNHPIGEACLQQMNLERILERYPGQDCRRIDLMIGEKALWGQGLGSEIIALLTVYAFQEEHADLVFGCDIGDYNPRSLRAFQTAGFQIVDKVEEPGGHKAKYVYDTLMTREQFLARRDIVP